MIDAKKGEKLVELLLSAMEEMGDETGFAKMMRSRKTADDAEKLIFDFVVKDGRRERFEQAGELMITVNGMCMDLLNTWLEEDREGRDE